MASDRDIAAFDRRATSYDAGWLGALHRRLVARVAEIVCLVASSPDALLDVGCGTGQLLRLLSASLPQGSELVGVDPAPGMVAVARGIPELGGRLRIEQTAAESLPFPDGSFDVVVSSVSFHHWADQQAGLCECARVLRPGGSLVLADLFGGWFALTAVFGQHNRARTPRRVEAFLLAAGLQTQGWQRLLGPLPIVQVVRAARPGRSAT